MYHCAQAIHNKNTRGQEFFISIYLIAGGSSHKYITRWPRNDICVQHFTTENTKYTTITIRLTIRLTRILHASKLERRADTCTLYKRHPKRQRT